MSKKKSRLFYRYMHTCKDKKYTITKDCTKQTTMSIGNTQLQETKLLLPKIKIKLMLPYKNIFHNIDN